MGVVMTLDFTIQVDERHLRPSASTGSCGSPLPADFHGVPRKDAADSTIEHVCKSTLPDGLLPLAAALQPTASK